MKKYLFLLLIPTFAIGQENDTANIYKNEISLSGGAAPDVSVTNGLINTGSVLSLGYFKNYSNTQLGVQLIAGTDNYYYGYINPTLVFNHLFQLNKLYIYAGTSAGYYYTEDVLDPFGSRGLKEEGFTASLQTGTVVNLTKHIALSGEVALRSIQTWFDDIRYVQEMVSTFHVEAAHYEQYRNNRFYLTLPVTVGIRYKF